MTVSTNLAVKPYRGTVSNALLMSTTAAKVLSAGLAAFIFALWVMLHSNDVVQWPWRNLCWVSLRETSCVVLSKTTLSRILEEHTEGKLDDRTWVCKGFTRLLNWYNFSLLLKVGYSVRVYWPVEDLVEVPDTMATKMTEVLKWGLVRTLRPIHLDTFYGINCVGWTEGVRKIGMFYTIQTLTNLPVESGWREPTDWSIILHQDISLLLNCGNRSTPSLWMALCD